jgi:hypothetical protein
MIFSLRTKTESCTAKTASRELSRKEDAIQVPDRFTMMVPRSLAAKETWLGALRRERRGEAAEAFKETTLFEMTLFK